MTPFVGESIILESDGGEFALTTHRVRVEHRRWGAARQGNVMLEDLVSCEVRHRSYPVLLVLAVIAALGCIAALDGVGGKDDKTSAGLVLGLLATAVGLVVAYMWTREQVLAFASAAAVLYIYTRGMSFANVTKITEAVLKAKNQRYLLLVRSP